MSYRKHLRRYEQVPLDEQDAVIAELRACGHIGERRILSNGSIMVYEGGDGQSVRVDYPAKPAKPIGLDQ